VIVRPHPPTLAMTQSNPMSLVRLLEGGRLRAIGTSNFKPAHLERVIAELAHGNEVAAISALDRGDAAGADSDAFGR
jgi:diketogulonate reductase-like aldo/keto reductase